ncbi:acyl carrier protein 1 [Hibiscus syriacus]|uniref:Acyl carrier protein 1 n=1 Tax=Hibiscus syriacus TaxID=106335 RepID=A0A6A2YHG5_HIBSY|nr:auxin-responsive protein SAUR78-like [Hibiscus syriacus]KAE8675297.1 acyl carrier protein 1 [Hibiscus syriacus]
MAKAGKLTKLKSAIKRWPSLKKLTRTGSAIAASDSEEKSNYPRGHHPVYVGKSRRRYLVRSKIIRHPLFQELVDRSGGSGGGDDDGDFVVSCEVVLFEHLLWMLENDGAQSGSMEELVEFYTC